MHDPDLRPPLVPPALLRAGKTAIGVLAVLLAVGGGTSMFVVAGYDVWAAWHALVTFADDAGGQAIVAAVKAVDAMLLGLVQFLLAAFLWQILDPSASLLDDDNIERLEEAKQILCTVVLVIIAVRMLGVVIDTDGDGLRWEHLLLPAGIAALALATASLKRRGTAKQTRARAGAGGRTDS